MSTSSPESSGAATPTSAAASSTFLSSSIYSAFGGFLRRLSSDPATAHGGTNSASPSGHAHRTPSPMRPPPLDPLVLHGFRDDTPPSARLLTPTVAEEIRIMVPERLRIEDDWKLVYSLDQDGASLATLYQKCSTYLGRRGGFVLVVKDVQGGTFGAYLSEAPHPSPHYFGTGECFLWRASLLAPLPPPPSSDTAELAARSTTIAAPVLIPDLLSDSTSTTLTTQSSTLGSLLSPSPASSVSAIPPSPSIRFKAFPYSGVNEYYIYCESRWLSVGGGDGKYGLWLDDALEKGLSSTCLTFGNEPLSDEGPKFHILGIEVWAIGAKDP